MKYSVAVLALAAAVARAQLGNIPTCALNCFIGPLTTDGCAGLTDFACHCSKSSLVSQVTPCVASACSVADQQKSRQAVIDTCAGAGVPITIPEIGGTASSSAAAPPPAASSTAAAPATSAAAPATSAVYGAAPTSSAVYAATTLATAPASASGYAAPSTGGVKPTSTLVPFTGAASHLSISGGLVAAVLAALAL